MLKPEKEEKRHAKCSHYFGYLARQGKVTSFPEECLICQKVVDCLLHSLAKSNVNQFMKFNKEQKKDFAPYARFYETITFKQSRGKLLFDVLRVPCC